MEKNSPNFRSHKIEKRKNPDHIVGLITWVS